MTAELLSYEYRCLSIACFTRERGQNQQACTITPKHLTRSDVSSRPSMGLLCHASHKCKDFSNYVNGVNEAFVSNHKMRCLGLDGFHGFWQVLL